jgi:hypothetical protein
MVIPVDAAPCGHQAGEGIYGHTETVADNSWDGCGLMGGRGRHQGARRACFARYHIVGCRFVALRPARKAYLTSERGRAVAFSFFVQGLVLLIKHGKRHDQLRPRPA